MANDGIGDGNETRRSEFGKVQKSVFCGEGVFWGDNQVRCETKEVDLLQ